MRVLIIIVLCLLPVGASALDCTPFQTWTCDNNGYYDLLDGVPGEPLCGVDYTGWTFHVVEVVVTQAGWFGFAGISAASSMNIVETAIILMDDCGAGTCVASTQSLGMAELGVCLDYGIYTFVVASNTTAPGAFMNIGLICPSCEDVLAAGYDCVYCETVGDADDSWGSVKSLYR